MKSPFPALRLCHFALWLLLASALSPVCFADPSPATSAQRAPGMPAGGRVLRDLAYVPNGHPRQKLDLYLPAEPKGPLVIWIHGGGWRAGSKDNPPGLAMLAAGYSVASVEYRFSQDAIFPAQIEDCKAAIRWLRAHSKEYGLDPKRFAAWGASAGGHLVALLAATGQVRDFDVGQNLDQSSAIQCGVDLFGPADFPAYDENLPTPMVQKKNPDSVLSLLLGGTVAEKMELAKRASPVTWVTKDTAPLLILQGTKDPLVPVDQSKRLAEKLKAADVEVTLDIIEGAGHGGPEFTSPAKLKEIAEFIVRHIAE